MECPRTMSRRRFPERSSNEPQKSPNDYGTTCHDRKAGLERNMALSIDGAIQFIVTSYLLKCSEIDDFFVIFFNLYVVPSNRDGFTPHDT